MKHVVMWWLLVCMVCLTVGYLFLRMHMQRIIIKDPLIIYENGKIEKMETQGVYGIISEQELNKRLGINYKVPFGEE